MTIEEMNAKKRELGLTSEMIAGESGIPLSTVQKVFAGVTKAPRKSTIDAIVKVLMKHSYQYPVHAKTFSGVGEARAAYGVKRKPVKKTIEDYYALPEEGRMELIDGKFYDMSSPSALHQMILGELFVLFKACQRQHGCTCKTVIAPFDVCLDNDKYTMVQPDLCVICEGYDIKADRYDGSPDLAVEILSPSTRKKDMGLKLYKYENAGVREYWMVDPKFRIVTVYRFEEEEYRPEIYNFTDEIPVGISRGKCKIDFSKVFEEIKSYYE